VFPSRGETSSTLILSYACLLKSEKLWFGGDSERAFAEALIRRRRSAAYHIPNDLSLANHINVASSLGILHRTRWINNPRAQALGNSLRTTFSRDLLAVVQGRIISASDDHSIHVYSPVTGSSSVRLSGHEGGFGPLASTKDTLVSGSTDRTVRIWDLSTGRCTHVFGGHTKYCALLGYCQTRMGDVEDEHGNVPRKMGRSAP